MPYLTSLRHPVCPLTLYSFCEAMGSLEAMIAAVEDMFEMFEAPGKIPNQKVCAELTSEAEVICSSIPVLIGCVEHAMGIDSFTDDRSGLISEFIFGTDVTRLSEESLDEVIANPQAGRLEGIETYEELYDYLTGTKH